MGWGRVVWWKQLRKGKVLRASRGWKLRKGVGGGRARSKLNRRIYEKLISHVILAMTHLFAAGAA
jgi:hypothetical protein